MLKSTVFELEQWFLHQNGPFFHQEFNGKGLWVLGSQFCTKKLKIYPNFKIPEIFGFLDLGLSLEPDT